MGLQEGGPEEVERVLSIKRERCARTSKPVPKGAKSDSRRGVGVVNCGRVGRRTRSMSCSTKLRAAAGSLEREGGG